MSFLSNFNTLVWILLGPSDLLESNEDMIFSVSVLSVGLTEKEILDLFFRKSEKCLRENEILSFVLLEIEEKVVENIRNCHWLGNSGTINSKILRDISRSFFNI